MADSIWGIVTIVITQMLAAAMLWWNQHLVQAKAAEDARIAAAALVASVDVKTAAVAATVVQTTNTLADAIVQQNVQTEIQIKTAADDKVTRDAQLGAIHVLVNSRLSETNEKLQAALDRIGRLEAVLTDVRATGGLSDGQAAALKGAIGTS